jgi:hypothetical protein
VTTVHTFHALAFIENFSLKELAVNYPEAKRARHQLSYPAAAGGTVFLFSFGVVIFFDVGQAGREGELLRLRRAPSGMRDAQVISEEFTVRELGDTPAAARPDVEGGVLVVDRQGSPQTEIRIGHPGVARRNPDFHAVSVMSAILGGLFNSRLNMNLREEKGYTYGASAGFDMRRARGPFTARAAVNTEVTIPALTSSAEWMTRVAGRFTR